MNTPFTGCATALITPMQGGAVDFAALARIIDFQIEGGVSALVPCGTTGEAPTLSEEEKRRVIAFTVEKADGRIPVIAGCGSPCTEYAARIAGHAGEDGASAVLAVTPYYNKATDEGIYLHYAAIADSTCLPVIVYNVPSRTGLSISMAAYEKLCGVPNICGVKEASGNLPYTAEVAARFRGRLAIYSGCDDLCASVYALGGCGLVSVVSNIMPEAATRLCRTCESGKLRDAAVLQQKLWPLIHCLSSEVNPIPVKTALSLMNFCSPEMRLPLCRMSNSALSRLRDELSSLGLITSP